MRAGGHLGHYNSYSWGATNIVTPATVGTTKCGNERQDWVHAKKVGNLSRMCVCATIPSHLVD